MEAARHVVKSRFDGHDAVGIVDAGETRFQRLDEHPAANRDFSLYLEVKSRFEEIVAPKTVIDTAQPLEICLKLALTAFG